MSHEADPQGSLGEAFEPTNEAPQTPKDRNGNFRAIIEDIARTRSSPFEVFTDFVRMAACALAAQTREEEYLAVAKNYSRDELGEFSKALAFLTTEMEEAPFSDVLGPYYIEIGSQFSRSFRGEFYTPKPVGDLMAKMLIDAPAVIEAGRAITVSDPASGSGGLVLSVAAEFAKAKAVDLLRVTCQDISKAACDMAYINTTLWGIPARIVQGDTLRATVEHEWKNIHWFRVGEPDRERIGRMMEVLRAPPVEPAPEETPDEKPEITDGDHGQREWTFE